MNCHMPSTTYMDVDDRRDHSFRVPDPKLSIATGTPNACTGCHLQDAKLADHKTKFPLRQYKDWIEAEKLGDKVVAEELSRINARMLLAIDSWYGEENKERTTYYSDLAHGLATALGDDRELEKAQADLMDLSEDASADEQASALLASMQARETSKEAQTELLALAKDVRSPAMIRASALAGIVDPDVLGQANETAVALVGG